MANYMNIEKYSTKTYDNTIKKYYKNFEVLEEDGNEVDIEVTGRHDPCVGIRAVPIAEAMVNLVIMDHLLRNRAQCGEVDQQLPFTK